MAERDCLPVAIQSTGSAVAPSYYGPITTDTALPFMLREDAAALTPGATATLRWFEPKGRRQYIGFPTRT